MAIRKLERSDWTSYFDRFSASLGTKAVTIEVTGTAVGHQVEGQGLALGGLVYDAKSDVFQVQTDTLDHLIHKPTEIFVDESILGVISLEVVDRDGVRQIISLTEPLMLSDDVPHEIVAEAQEKLDELVEDLKTARDELRLQSHLLKAELREEWDELEEKWHEIEPEIARLGDRLTQAKADLSARAARVAVEMHRAYKRLHDRLSQ